MKCAPQITTTINRLGGLSDEGLAPRKFYDLPEGPMQQLSLFEEGVVQSFARGAVILSGLVAKLPARQTASEESRDRANASKLVVESRLSSQGG